jgi:hypothetical protein
VSLIAGPCDMAANDLKQRLLSCLEQVQHAVVCRGGGVLTSKVSRLLVKGRRNKLPLDDASAAAIKEHCDMPVAMQSGAGSRRSRFRPAASNLQLQWLGFLKDDPSSAAQVAPFSRLGRTLVDRAVRDTLQTTSVQFSIDNVGVLVSLLLDKCAMQVMQLDVCMRWYNARRAWRRAALGGSFCH